MIQDNSKEFHGTWSFLNRRLGEAVQLHDILIKSEVTSQTAKDTAQSVFVTVIFHFNLNLNVLSVLTLNSKCYMFCKLRG